MKSNYPTLPSPLAPIPCHLLACEQALCLGKRVKKTSWLFQITISPNRDPVHRLPFCRLLHRPRRILAFRAHQQAREYPLLPVWKRNKEIYFPRLLLAETQLVWQRAVGMNLLVHFKTERYFSIACLLLKEEEDGLTKTAFKMLFKSGKGVVYF